jgi:hypothetical protein
MANFFIAVGGTGQMVAMAYWRLRKLMPWLDHDPVNMFHMDKDVIDTYMSVVEDSGHIDPVPPGAQDSFGAHFKSNEFPYLCRDILDSLFTTEEQNTPIDRGMYARPPVGATVLMDMLNNPGGRVKDLLQGSNRKQDSYLTDGNRHTIVICGSAMGGTGAGGVPSLAQYIDKAVTGIGSTERENVKIYVFYFLKHFNLPATDANDETIRIQNEQITTNAESGICYLKDQIAKGTDGCLIMGLNTTSSRSYQAVGLQTEQSQPLYILAALYAQKAFTARDNIFPDGENLYAHGVNNSSSLFDDSKALDSNGIPVSLEVRGEMGLNDLIGLNNASVDIVDMIRHLIHPLPKGLFWRGLPGNLNKAIKELALLNSFSDADAAKHISDALQKSKQRIEALTGWYKDSSKDANLTLKEVKNLTIPAFQKTLKRPIGFIKQSSKNMGVVSLQGIDKVDSAAYVAERIVRSVYSTMKEAFFN